MGKYIKGACFQMKIDKNTVKVIYILALLLIAITLVSCNSNIKTINEKEMVKLHGKSIVVVKYKKHLITLIKADKKGSSAKAAGKIRQESTSAVQKNISDPALRIGENLKNELVNRFQMTVVKAKIAPLESDNRREMINVYRQKADFILDFKTSEMGYLSYPNNAGKYRVKYMSRLKLINSKSRRIVVAADCHTFQGDDKNPPTKDKLLGNNARLLRSYLARSIDLCTKKMSDKIFSSHL